MIDKEGLKLFIDELLVFIEDDYLCPVHNFNRDLKYSVKELDEHYLCDYRFLFDKYYEAFLVMKEKNLYPNISIIYVADIDDYLVEVSPRQMIGAEARAIARRKELDELIEQDIKLIEEGKIDEVNPATLWLLGIDKK